MKPRVFVELGTQLGFSYFVFCQALASLGSSCRAHGIDHWTGDSFTGSYNSDVYRTVNRYNDDTYASFSTLIRSTFSNALSHFPNNSIDLLHIDGSHTYEDVQQDFEEWLPKLSDHAIVLFHDTAVTEPGYEVWRYWAALRGRYPHFDFFHGHGLGVLGVGSNLSQPMTAFFDATTNPSVAQEIQSTYSRLGRLVSLEASRPDLETTVTELHTTVTELHTTVTELHTTVTELHTTVTELEKQTEERTAERDHYKNHRDALLKSTSWKVTAPLRLVASHLL